MQDGLNELQKKVLAIVEKEIPKVLKMREPDKSRCLMCLSYEYFIQDMEEKAFNLLDKADPNYFKGQLAVDMKSDPNIARIVMSIMGKLLESGYVKVGNEEKKR